MKGRARKGSALLRLDLVQRRGSIFCQKSSQPREAEETSDQRHQIANLAYWVTGTEGSNPSLSANESQVSGILRRRSQNARVYERCARPIGTGECGDGEPCRVTLIFSLWASNSVPMPAFGERKVRAATTDIASECHGHLELPTREGVSPEHRLLERRHVSWEPETRVRMFLATQDSERLSARTMRAEARCAG